MTPRATFLAVLLRNRRRVDAERRAFARRVDAIVATETRGMAPFDVFAYMRVQIALGPLFDEFYGQWRGDTRARFWRLIVEEATAARALAFRRARADVIRRLADAPAVLKAIRQDAA